jgi:thiol:disulfide interchange protein
MKKSLFLSLFTAAFFLGGCSLFAPELREGDEEYETEEHIQEEREAAEDAGNEESEETVQEGSYFIDFDQEKYEAALAEGKTVFLDFHASWCPTCKVNEPIIREVLDERTDEGLAAFKVDYDNSEALQRQFGVRSQSTLILIQGGQVDSYKTFGPGLISEEQMLEFLDQ